MNYLDLHTHKAAQQAGITSIQSLSLTQDIFLAMPKKKPISIGLHPWYATLDQLDLQMEYLKVLANQENVLLIGECGLDRLKGAQLENQLVILEAQVLLAEQLKKPLILHCVKCFSELISLKDRLNVQVPMIIHGFTKNQVLGKQLLAKGFLLSFGSAILHPDSAAAKLLAELDCFFLETDDSESTIREIYQAAANVKKCSIDELKARIFDNWRKLNLI